jgi:hypothetical protein
MGEGDTTKITDEEAAHKLCLNLAVCAWRLVAIAHGDDAPHYKDNPLGDSVVQQGRLRFQDTSITDNPVAFGTAIVELRNACADYTKIFNRLKGNVPLKLAGDGTALNEGCGGRFAATWHEVAIMLARDILAIVNGAVPRGKIFTQEKVFGPSGIVPVAEMLATMPEKVRPSVVVLTSEMRSKVYGAINRTFSVFNIEQLEARMGVEYQLGRLDVSPKTDDPVQTQRKLRNKRRVDAVKDARDQWIYQQCFKGIAYDTVALRLKKKSKKWDRIDTKQGIRYAAQEYAKRHNLPPLPLRQDRDQE